MIKINDLSIRQGDFTLENISFEVPTGHYAVLMGKTGSGKSTILEAICGLRSIRSGRIDLGGRDVTELKPGSRGVGYVPQDAALFMSMSVRDNLAFALRIRHWKKAAINQRVDELAQMLGVEHLLDRKPHGLSGGEAQRVSLGRALAFHPTVLCLDEPLSALDESTRKEMYKVLESVKASAGVTTLHVTHHSGEAQRLADNVLKLQAGRVLDTTKAATDISIPVMPSPADDTSRSPVSRQSISESES
ncbi:Sulfate/thiosulfate import ATP-binding protein CysA [Symmachiella dynata]|uniref:Sulfate/thiosulfate import ATP-binding protein CysA n=1 Tax=Symmachiella dynata TaxID=2527995 RepID=A0A517ZM50_9PLAN|nr:ATP-binding cassette domain-containing protein [Symmachiella dynata]QDU43546.1 Sulfate/thiosulfate import ATP-binding protein CysA [Symmachiella dynata]